MEMTYFRSICLVVFCQFGTLIPFHLNALAEERGNIVDEDRSDNQGSKKTMRLISELTRLGAEQFDRRDESAERKGLWFELNDSGQVIAICIPNSKCTDETLRVISYAENLAVLDLGNTSISSAGMAHLRNLKHLGSVGLYGTNVDDDCCKVLSNFKKTIVLYLGNTRITDAGVKRLSNLRNLQHVMLNGNNVTDEALKSLRNCSTLALLDMSNTKITNTGIKYLSEKTPLIVNDGGVELRIGVVVQYINVKNTLVDSGCVDHLMALDLLGTLELSKGQISVDGINRLKKKFDGIVISEE
ncbi:MAG: hypothetical protein ACKVT0_23540 [Planctomycetaceae bacterium]